jgi:alpha-glucosidase
VKIFFIRKSLIRLSRRLTLLFILAALAACTLLCPSVAAQTRTPLGNVSAVKFGDGVELKAGAGAVRVTAVDDSTIRVWISPDGTFAKDESWAVIPKTGQAAAKATVADAPDAVTLSTSRFRARIEKNPLRILFTDLNGRVINEDDPARPAAWTGQAFQVWKRMPADEHYVGLGDKSGPIDHRGQAYTMWNTDAFGWQQGSDPLYKDIPFFMGLRNGDAYGIFFDNTWRTNFNFGKDTQDAFSFGSEGGELKYYFFYGPEPKKVIKEFTDLTGKPPLWPMWTFGYQQSRASYPTEARVREIAQTFRDKKIPLDVIFLDIDYQLKYRPFTFDPKTFPNFVKMIGDLRAQGTRVVAITDLHLAKLPGYAPYDSGMAGDHFVQRPDGSLYVGSAWPGDSVIPDFTRARTREWWGTLYKDFVADGISGFWNDMNEPALFNPAQDDAFAENRTMPSGNLHRLDDGRIATHREIHNAYGVLNGRSTFEGLRKLRPEERPFVLARSTYAGGQRFFISWTGDTTSSWQHMQLSVSTLLSIGISGFPFIGDDISGFWGYPKPELVTRWMELGVFNPIYRNHSASPPPQQGPNLNAGQPAPPPPFREPWVDGPEHERIRKKYIELRYRLMPYIYTAAEETTHTGLPVMRPIFLEYPKVPFAISNDLNEFLFGRDLLVAPKVHEEAQPYSVTLPTPEWFDYWTGKRIDGTQPFSVNPDLGTIPVYVRAGAIIPQQPVVQNTGEVPQGPLELRVYPGADCSGNLYMDDGHTYAYQQGVYSRRQFACATQSGALTLTLGAEEGTYKPWFNDFQIQIFGVGHAPTAVTVENNAITNWNYDAAAQTLTFTTPAVHAAESITVRP